MRRVGAIADGQTGKRPLSQARIWDHGAFADRLTLMHGPWRPGAYMTNRLISLYFLLPWDGVSLIMGAARVTLPEDQFETKECGRMEKLMPTQPTRQVHPKRAMLLTLIVLAILFLALALTDAFMSIHALDVRITDFIQTLKTPLLTAVADFVSWFGLAPQGYLMLVLSVIALFLARRRWEAAVLGVSSVLTIALNVLAKMLVRYPGPTAPQTPELWTFNDFTFPSGHVMFFMAFFGFAFYLIASRMKRSWIRMALLIPFGFLIVCVGFFRVYLLAHWTSDVLGGYALGGVMLILSILVDQRRMMRKQG